MSGVKRCAGEARQVISHRRRRHRGRKDFWERCRVEANVGVRDMADIYLGSGGGPHLYDPKKVQIDSMKYGKHPAADPRQAQLMSTHSISAPPGHTLSGPYPRRADAPPPGAPHRFFLQSVEGEIDPVVYSQTRNRESQNDGYNYHENFGQAPDYQNNYNNHQNYPNHEQQQYQHNG